MKWLDVRRNSTWHIVKTFVIAAVFFTTLVLYQQTQNVDEIPLRRAGTRTILSTSSVVLNSKQEVMLSAGFRKFLLEKSSIDDTDDDGNSKLCHKVSRYRGDQCQFVLANCPQPMGGSYLNYMVIRYCWLRNVPAIFFILGIFWVIMLFYMLSDTAEANFCPSLTEISRYLRLSPNVAGVTFLALGNGAPDIASIIAGVFSGSTGFGVGEPIGAGLFVTTTVMAAVTLFSEVTVDGAPFLRDAITYLISISFVFALYLSGQIVLWQSLLCLLIYFGYVISVIIGRLVFLYVIKPRQEILAKQKLAASQPSNATGEVTSLLTDDVNTRIEQEEEISASWLQHKQPHIGVRRIDDIPRNLELELKQMGARYFGATYFPKVGVIYESISPISTPTQRRETIDNIVDDVTSNVNFSSRDTTSIPMTRKEGSVIISDHFSRKSRIDTDSTIDDEDSHVSEYEYDYSGFWGGFKRRRDQFLSWIEWNEKTWYQKIFYFVEWPTILARNLTIPKADPRDWSKFFAIVSPPFIGPFVLFALQRINMTVGNSSMPLWSLLTIIGLIPSIIIVLTSNRRSPPRYHFIFVFAAFVLSILWIMIIANELVGLLQSIGIMCRISDGILAMTVLAWGNSLGDLVSDVIISRQGFPSMAVGAVYSGPCLNLLIGLGLSITTHCITKAPAFIITATTSVTMSFIFLIATMVSALIIIPVTRFRSPKSYGIMLLLFYIIFMILSILMESNIIFSRE
jgi:sodium/potassium/calcium exchanger 6